MTDQWYVRIIGEEVGPVTAGDLASMLNRGQIDRSEAVRAADERTWRRVEDVLGVAVGAGASADGYGFLDDLARLDDAPDDAPRPEKAEPMRASADDLLAGLTELEDAPADPADDLFAGLDALEDAPEVEPIVAAEPVRSGAVPPPAAAPAAASRPVPPARPVSPATLPAEAAALPPEPPSRPVEPPRAIEPPRPIVRPVPARPAARSGGGSIAGLVKPLAVVAGVAAVIAAGYYGRSLFGSAGAVTRPPIEEAVSLYDGFKVVASKGPESLPFRAFQDHWNKLRPELLTLLGQPAPGSAEEKAKRAVEALARRIEAFEKKAPKAEQAKLDAEVAQAVGEAEKAG